MPMPRLTTLNSLLLVIDVQDKLLVKMPDAAGLVRDVAFLMDAAKLLEVPVLATEQYPKGLGPTTAEIARRLPPSIPTKVAFSCCGAAGVLSELRSSGRKHVVVAGMEAHVCVMQTVLDLLAEGLGVFLPLDAVQSRHRLDQDTAIRRMESEGAILTTAETVAFEWLGGADHPRFKAVSQMIKDRVR
ncbi:MAG: isochorismatase family protein [Planctomycetes bacterium]|nr:isochorismatase family protein [Planctomycetota bacterium]